MNTSEAKELDSAEAKNLSCDGPRIERRGRYWAVLEGQTLVCITVYLKGAREVVRRLQPQV
jgi:hypothetical protein